jgi:hypothetical protein
MSHQWAFTDQRRVNKVTTQDKRAVMKRKTGRWNNYQFINSLVESESISKNRYMTKKIFYYIFCDDPQAKAMETSV